MTKSQQDIMYSNEDELISKALCCLENKLRYGTNEVLNNSKNVRAYVHLQLAHEKEEVFAVLFLDNHHRLIVFEKLFYGTINESAVYPRKVVIKALEHNAAKIIIAHNHPSGNCAPSEADKVITKKLREILDIIDVILIDHIVVTHNNAYSFAEYGIL
jgi:DNA repair protein RadC